ncbi:MAG: HlyD family secretion protein [Verrucomicrobiota bacterium]
MNAPRTETKNLGPGELNRVTAVPVTTETRNTNAPVKMAPARSKKLFPWFSLLFMVVLASYGGYRWWQYTQAWVKTDNAYVAGHIHQTSTRIAGTVTEVLVLENQAVTAGQVLARLDRVDLEVRRDQVRAAQIQAEAQLNQAQAQVRGEEAAATKAQLDFDRADKLSHEANSVISQQELDSAKAALAAAQAAVAAARARTNSAEAQVQVASANLKDAELQLTYTDITAPAAGRIGRKNVETGNRVQPGQALLAVVSPEVWVVANFKETQLTHLRPGQTVKLNVDTFPGRVFAGRVESVAPASGAQFALLPPDNATGNFTKIVQRVPVKIVFDDEALRDCAGRIVPGMSATVKVNIRL